MCITSNNFYTNGNGIAALFSGFGGDNYTYNSYGANYNFIGSGLYGNGCCGGNWDNKSIWRAVLGGAAGTVCSIGLAGAASYVSDRQTTKALEKQRAKDSEESLNNALKTLGLGSKTRAEVMKMTSAEIDAIKIKGDYNEAALAAANTKVDEAERKVTKAKNSIKAAKAEVNDSTKGLEAQEDIMAQIKKEKPNDYANDAKYKAAKTEAERLEKLKASYTSSTGSLKEALKEAEAEQAEAEKEVEKIEDKREAFDAAKKTVKKAIEKHKMGV